MIETSKKARRPRVPTGPVPDRVKIEGNWKDTVKAALEKKRPAGGWPKQPGNQHKK